jgi:hypothetical protein
MVAMCVGLVAAPALAQPEGLLYYASFDEYAAADWSAGSRVAQAGAPDPILIAGHSGKALSLTGGRWFNVPANDGNFVASQGTVQMWLRPAWDGDDGEVHQIFNSRAAEKNYLNLNTLLDGTLGVATGGAVEGGYKRVSMDRSGWRAGEWHHVAFTWGERKLALFVDGEKIGEETDAIPLKFEPDFVTFGRSFNGDIDELSIWSVALATVDPDASIAVPDVGEPVMPGHSLPPLGEIDRYQYDVPDTVTGCVIVPKAFVDEVDPAVAPDEFPDAPALSTFAARDEWQTVAFVAHATRDLEAFDVTASALTGPGGATIPATNLQVRLNRRVMQRTAPRVPDDSRVPRATLLDPAEPFDLPAGHFKEVAVTVHVPADATPGTYAGEVAVTAASGELASVPLTVEVLPFRLVGNERKQWGMYYRMDLDPSVREGLMADLADLREHGVEHLFTWLTIGWDEEGGEVCFSYDEVDEGLAVLREAGFAGTVVFDTGLVRLADMLVKAAGEGAVEEEIWASDQFCDLAEAAIRGLDVLRAKYPEFELVVTHMDEVLGRGRLPKYIALTKPVRRVPDQRVYITLHTLPREGVPEMTAELDPWMDIRGYHGYSQAKWLQSGHAWDELAQEIADADDEMWMYYNPHRPFYVAEWSRVINGLFMWWSPIKVHCPFRYRTMITWPLPFIHNMAYTVRSLRDMKTPIALRNWEGFRLGMQDCRYLCMLEDLVTRAKVEGAACVEAEAWLAGVREMMPDPRGIARIDGPENNYPLVRTVSETLSGSDFQSMRRTTADHIVALRQAMGVTD